jgi:ribosomal protein S18 acetylase RimI-like enzyme
MSSEIHVETVTDRSDSHFRFATELFLSSIPQYGQGGAQLDENHHLYVATRDCYFAGAANIYTAPDIDHAYVWQLAVAPKHRNQGIGSALLRHVIEEAPLLGYQKIGISPTNTDNARLYRRLGFNYDLTRTTDQERGRLFLDVTTI